MYSTFYSLQWEKSKFSPLCQWITDLIYLIEIYPVIGAVSTQGPEY